MSDYIAEPFVSYNKMTKVLKVYDGIQYGEFESRENGKRLRKQLGIRKGEYLVGHIASISARWKKHETFIQMAAILKHMLPNVRFVHFGHIPPPGSRHRRRYDELCRMIGHFGLNDCFIWAGVSNNIAEMMTALDLLVHPTDQEPFGRVAIEAMAAQVPVVGPQSGGIAESVVHEETGMLVPADQPRAFAEAAAMILRDERLRRQMGEAGANYVRKNFSIEQHVRRMTEIFDSI
jgi:glycosyltransferase involved in cell wall biosynthesis